MHHRRVAAGQKGSHDGIERHLKVTDQHSTPAGPTSLNTHREHRCNPNCTAAKPFGLPVQMVITENTLAALVLVTQIISYDAQCHMIETGPQGRWQARMQALKLGQTLTWH
jgi:hypothetical protein